MYEINIESDDKGLLGAAVRAGAPLRETQQAVKDSALLLHRRFQWSLADPGGRTVTYSGGSFIIHRVTGTYHGGISTEWPFEGMTLAAWVGPKQVDYAPFLERGIDAFDLTEAILKSPKAKLSKSGHKYMVIPFWYKGGKARAQAEYGDIETARKAGVVKSIGGEKAKKPRAHHNEWATLRTVSNKPGVRHWWHPGITPRPVGKATKEFCAEQVKVLLKTGMAKDIARILRSS
ncbi:MAG: hypothetical protein KAW17_09755 [Candidatus Eisenbacteria sp.]|nr:hypothetical protein [Candidatus Eisenbacteria bacterium]